MWDIHIIIYIDIMSAFAELLKIGDTKRNTDECMPEDNTN